MFKKGLSESMKIKIAIYPLGCLLASPINYAINGTKGIVIGALASLLMFPLLHWFESRKG